MLRGMMRAARRITLEVLGWLLVVAGIAALVLPGPGLLMLFGGIAILSQQYEWAERRLEPLKFRALKGAAESVETWVRITLSSLAALVLLGCGVVWVVGPDVPGWWPVAERWWLPGEDVTGVTQVLSALVALALIVYSYRRFHGNPDAVAELEADMHRAQEDRERRAEV
ncbi:PGPGW domain-containing protein [Nocardioides pantholopis]|uniref:PGPGW domain-containing protein n=1 Tax=Nocardioides pantholopis TaxID=2483798 RepID=UPI001F14A8E6|nr:PGPGW domain-containing protein [Nocardioides pantholopis]